MRLHLIQSHELFGPPERQDELRECWRRNEGLFDQYTHPEGRPTFTELFAMCDPDMVNVMVNSDIYFEVRPKAPPRGTVYALSRYDVDTTGIAVLWNHHDSQDTWIIEGRPQRVNAPYPMGTPGCDNALIHALRRSGLTVLNPSKTIRSYHLHLCNYRSYADNGGKPIPERLIKRAPKPYAFAPPVEL